MMPICMSLGTVVGLSTVMMKSAESLVVIGGNYIGLEMGQLFSNLGTKVTIVEALERIAPLEEPEISEWMRRILTQQGITFNVAPSSTGPSAPSATPPATPPGSAGGRR